MTRAGVPTLEGETGRVMVADRADGTSYLACPLIFFFSCFNFTVSLLPLNESLDPHDYPRPQPLPTPRPLCPTYRT